MTAPIRTLPELPIVRTMQDAVDVFRIMKEHWGLTNGFCDDVGGLTTGHTDKILGPTEEKRLGYDTFALFMEMCVIEFVPRINPEALMRMEAIWETRERPLYPNAKNRPISKKLIERAKPHVLKECASAGGHKRALSLPGKLRSKIARKGGKSRMKKATKAERSAMMLKGWETRRSKAKSAITPQINATGAALDVGSLELLECGASKSLVLAGGAF